MQHFASITGGDQTVTIYTIMQTAKLNGLNPESYRRDTLVKDAKVHPINRVDELMPWQEGEIHS
jgi:hypothetical protein